MAAEKVPDTDGTAACGARISDDGTLAMLFGSGAYRYSAFLTTVGQTFLSAAKDAALMADKNVCPTEHAVVRFPCVVRNADCGVNVVSCFSPG